MDEIIVRSNDQRFDELTWLISARATQPNKYLDNDKYLNNLIIQMSEVCCASDGVAAHFLHYEPLPIGAYNVTQHGSILCITPVMESEYANQRREFEGFFKNIEPRTYELLATTIVRNEQAAAEIMRVTKKIYPFDCIRQTIAAKAGGYWKVSESEQAIPLLRFELYFGDVKGKHTAFISSLTGYKEINSCVNKEKT